MERGLTFSVTISTTSFMFITLLRKRVEKPFTSLLCSEMQVLWLLDERLNIT